VIFCLLNKPRADVNPNIVDAYLCFLLVFHHALRPRDGKGWLLFSH
jgi:hypothetical protein